MSSKNDYSKDAINGPRGDAEAFIRAHFDNLGGNDHPILGALDAIADEIEISFERDNTVSSLIRFYLNRLPSPGV